MEGAPLETIPEIDSKVVMHSDMIQGTPGARMHL